MKNCTYLNAQFDMAPHTHTAAIITTIKLLNPHKKKSTYSISPYKILENANQSIVAEKSPVVARDQRE